MKKRKPIMQVLWAVPYILAVIGLIMAGDKVQDALYKSLRVYTIRFADSSPNILIEIARWTGPITILSFIVFIVKFLRVRAGNFIKYHFNRNSVAVYGPDSEKSKLSGLKASNKINGKDLFVKAHSYIIMNDEAENFRFYNEHRAELKNKKVYLKADSVWSRFVKDEKVKLKFFSPEENAARLFWKWDKLWENNSPYDLINRPGHKLNIAVLGFGKLGEELIYWGMQSNIYFADQEIAYHIFGDCSEFMRTHTSLGYIADKLVWYKDDWTDRLDIIEKADIVIVVDQEDQNILIKDLLFTTVRKGI